MNAELPADSIPDPISAGMRNPEDDRLYDSVLFQLAVLSAARNAGDVALESITRQRLVAMGCRIIFTDPKQKGADR